MTWQEVAELVPTQPVVLIPVGAVEQHGRQTPTGMDNFVADAVCRGVAERTDSVILPATPFGCSQTFSGFPGTIVIQPSSLLAYLRDVVDSLVRHGFKYLVLVDNHGGNAATIEQLAWDVRQAHGLVLARVHPYGLGKEVGRDLYTEGTAHWGHGSEPVVTLARAVVPDDVRMDLAAPDDYKRFEGFAGFPGKASELLGANAKVYLHQSDQSDSGTKGDPTRADGERGKVYLGRIIDAATAFVKAFRQTETQVPARFRGHAG